MTKEEHIKYWIDIAENDWEIALRLFSSGDYLYSLFFAHLVIEKISKGLWVKVNPDNFPPKVHNVLFLLEKSGIQLIQEQKEFLTLLNEFNIDARYPDYKQKIYKICTKEYSDDMLKKVDEMRKWLLNKMQ